MEERCPLNSSLLKLECGHCRRLESGEITELGYTLKTGEFYLEYPVVEIRKDGGPITPYDRRFAFGLGKAELLLVCVQTIGDFACCDEEARWDSKQWNKDFWSEVLEQEVRIQWYRGFERSDGTPIERPHLRLQIMPGGQPSIGLGMRKCQAVWAVRIALLKWVKKQWRVD